MKLNKKGWSKAERYLCPECWKDTNWERPNEPEFNSSDFKNTIMLTIKEAKRALGCIKMSRAVADDIKGKDKKLQLKLQELIAKAEGKR